MKIPLTALLPEEITEVLALKPAFKGRQIFEWIHKPTFQFEKMTNLAGTLRNELTTKALILSSQVVKRIKGEDGSEKIRLQLADSQQIEAVLLTAKNGRKTVCLSTQVGCGMGCKFCKTAQMGFIRNLTSHEIVEEFLHLRSLFGDISNVVFMGMGEPLHNFNNVQKAIYILTHPAGANLSLRKITISTCGFLKGIERLCTEGPYVRLAFSLITADPLLRDELMPVNTANPLTKVKQALMQYQSITGKRITLEIVLLKGKNDKLKDIEFLIKFIDSLKVAINVIPWNKASGLDFIEPDKQTSAWFIQKLRDQDIKVTQRYRRGKSINAACGQLCIEEKGESL
jgi:23S rRNA (adenine2503-C2)-methyltransferase